MFINRTFLGEEIEKQNISSVCWLFLAAVAKVLQEKDEVGKNCQLTSRVKKRKNSEILNLQD